MSKLLNLLTALLSLVGHGAAGTFLTNRVLIGAPERLPKSFLIAGHMAGWVLIGVANVIASGKHGFLRAILLPTTFGRLWGLFFVLVGARWLAQEVYRKRNPTPPLTEVISTSVRRVDMRHDIIAHEGMSTSGVRGIINRVNELYDLEIVTHEVRLRHLPAEFDGFTLVQISDVHHMAGPSAEFIRRYISLTLEMQPDLIALTGDYQTYPQDVEGAANLLTPIGAWSREKRDGKGAVAILGNHDREAGSDHVTDALRRANVPVLSNNHIELTRDSAHIYIAGIADPWSGRADLDIALLGIPPNTCTILLAHVPDFLVEASGKVDLQLSGHNHGGQIKLPILGALLVSSRYSRRYVEGFYTRKGTLMYVSRGIGGKPPIRLGSKPEITRFILRTPL
jgi:predicted MPP superfamily phosphohydrolase